MPNPQHLWQLISPTLPVGGYAYSQGLEYAIHAGHITDETDCLHWIHGLATEVMPTVDLPLLHRMHRAWQHQDPPTALNWNRHLLATRETAELRHEDCTRGRALHRLAQDLNLSPPPQLATTDTITIAAVFSWLGVRWNIPLPQLTAGYLWSWCEGQVAAAVKLVPLGQTAGQRLLLALGEASPAIVRRALACPDHDLGTTAYGLALASAAHETQYTRLFRS